MECRETLFFLEGANEAEICDSDASCPGAILPRRYQCEASVGSTPESWRGVRAAAETSTADEQHPEQRLGFAVKVLGRENLPSHDTCCWQSNPALAAPMTALSRILDYAAEVGIRMGRVWPSAAATQIAERAAGCVLRQAAREGHDKRLLSLT